MEEKSCRKTLWKEVKLLKMSNFTSFHNVFYAIYILKSFNSHISDVVCSFFEFVTVSKWCIREMVKPAFKEKGSFFHGVICKTMPHDTPMKVVVKF